MCLLNMKSLGWVLPDDKRFKDFLVFRIKCGILFSLLGINVKCIRWKKKWSRCWSIESFHMSVKIWHHKKLRKGQLHNNDQFKHQEDAFYNVSGVWTEDSVKFFDTQSKWHLNRTNGPLDKPSVDRHRKKVHAHLGNSPPGMVCKSF